MNHIETGDNSQVIVSGFGGRRAFDLAMELLFAGHTTASHYKIKKIDRSSPAFLDKKVTPLFEDSHVCMIFFWYPEKDTIPLPYPMNFKDCANLAWGWLQTREYGPEPDHDGSNGQGWSVFNESWGHVDNSHGAIGAVSPQWIWHGK